jgi:pimeloyl-ACP methyl ester carboxylesterase
VSWHPQGRFLRAGEHQCHVVDTGGGGPVVLLLHGFLHSAWTWRETIEALAPRHRVIAPDLLGFGRSDTHSPGRGAEAHALPYLRESVHHVLNALGVGRLAAVVGNSLGAAIAVDLALREPSRVERLALTNPFLWPLRLPGRALQLLALQAFAPLYRATAGDSRFVTWALRASAYRIPVDGEILAGFHHLGRRGSHAAACHTARHLRGVAELAARMRRAILPPTFVLWGERDRILRASYRRRIETILPAASWVTWPQAGHCPHEEQPADFLRLLEHHLERPPRAPA